MYLSQGFTSKGSKLTLDTSNLLDEYSSLVAKFNFIHDSRVNTVQNNQGVEFLTQFTTTTYCTMTCTLMTQLISAMRSTICFPTIMPLNKDLIALYSSTSPFDYNPIVHS